MSSTIEERIRDVILVLHEILKHKPLPGEAGEAMKRLGASLMTEAQHAAKRLADLKNERSRLIVRRGQLAILVTDQNDLLTRNAKGQAPALLRLTEENVKRTASDHDTCIKQLAAVEAEIAVLSKTETAAIAA